MEQISKELLQKALDSILHGSTQIVTTTDYNGNPTTQEVRINDLRQPLVQKLAEQLVKSEAFKDAVTRAVTTEVIQKIQESIVTKMNYSDLPYSVKDKVEKELKENYQGVKVQKYKIVAGVIED